MSEYPKLSLVRQDFPVLARPDLGAALSQAFVRFRPRLKPGQQVAVAVGSRGIARLSDLVASVLAELRAAGAAPFLVPAMGSHGGGTAEGQMTLLRDYGITEEALGVPIRPALDVQRLGTTANGLEVWFSTEALRADAILLVNRVKPHTDFAGALGSGLLKMAVVGLGKHVGATRYHAAALRLGYQEVLQAMAKVVLARAPLVGGVAVVEDQRHQLARVVGLLAEEIEAREPELCAEAKALMPTLPFDDVDFLIVDQMGKNISGTGMDPAVIGRTIHGYTLREDVPRPAPRVRRLFARELSPESHGNAVGIGLADFTTLRLARAIDWRATTVNSLTALSLQAAKLPIHFETDREVIERALGTLAPAEPRQLKIVRLRDTLSLEYFQASEACLEELARQPGFTVLGERRALEFDESGNLKPLVFPAATGSLTLPRFCQHTAGHV
jgi:hypothetical protein